MQLISTEKKKKRSQGVNGRKSCKILARKIKNTTTVYAEIEATVCFESETCKALPFQTGGALNPVCSIRKRFKVQYMFKKKKINKQEVRG